jgi:hypothetical protein
MPGRYKIITASFLLVSLLAFLYMPAVFGSVLVPTQSNLFASSHYGPMADAPVLSGIETSALLYTENDPGKHITDLITVTDADDINLDSAKIRITVNYAVNEDILGFINTAEITGVWNADSGEITLTGTASLSTYIDALRNITYRNPGNNPRTDVRTVSLMVHDGDSYSNIVTRNITIIPVNDIPILGTIESLPVTYNEGTGTVQITNTLTVSDSDDVVLVSAIVSVSSGFHSGQDVLSYTLNNGITPSWDALNGTLTLTGNVSPAVYQNALRSVTYENISADPAGGIRTIAFLVYDGKNNSNYLSRNISVTPVNNAPVLAGLETGILLYTENEAPKDITGTITVNDTDDTNMESATISISSNYHSDQDVLSFPGASGFSGSWDPVTGTFTLTGSNTKLKYRNALRDVAYHNTSENPSTDTRSVSFTVSDGTANSNTLSRSIAITSVNDIPVLAHIESTALLYNEGSGDQIITGSLTVADTDNIYMQSATVAITTGYHGDEDVLSYAEANGISASWNSFSGILTLTGNVSKAAFQAALRTVKYKNTSVNPNAATRKVTFTAFDGTGFSNTQTRDITVNSVNSAPVLATLETDSLTYTENDAAKIITSAITVADSDDINLETATIAITSGFRYDQDVLSFTNANGISGSWNAATGILTLTGSATLVYYQQALRSITYANTSEDPSVTPRTISFTINDGSANSSTMSRIIKITQVNDAPLLAAIEPSVLNYSEGDGAVQITNTITITDPDNLNLQSATITISQNYQNGQDILSYGLNGGIATSWNAGAGQLVLTGNVTVTAFQTALRNVTFENTSSNPVAATRVITFVVNDGHANSNAPARSVSVGSSNNAPVLGNLEGTTLTYTENEVPKHCSDNITITDPDDINMESATVAITSNYQSAVDLLTFTNVNGITGSWNAVNGSMTLTGTSSLTNYRAALRNVSYSNTSDNPVVLTRVISFTVNDGTSNSNTPTRSITITPVNDAPLLSTIEPGVLNYTEGTAAVQITNTITTGDPDNINLQSATISVTTGYLADQDVLSYSPANGITPSWNALTGILTLTGNVNLATFQTALRSVKYENTSLNPSLTTRIITFTTNDGLANSNAVTRSITIARVNNPPILRNIESQPLLYLENDTTAFISATIQIADTDDVTIESATITIITNYQSGQDFLAFVNANGISGTWNPVTATLNLSGSSSVANYVAALRNVRYGNTSDNPSVLVRTVSFVVNDGDANSNVVQRSLSVTGVNDPPVALNVNLTRPNNRIGTLHTGSFTYSDPETGSLTPGIHVFKWYRKRPDGNIIWIDSVSAVTYTPVLADGGDSICFEVTPRDNLGLLGIPVKSPYKYINAAPVARNVNIYATNMAVGKNLYGRFTYSDTENNPAGNHTYQWYRSSVPSGTGTPITGAVDTLYKLVIADDQKYIRFVITPAATSGSTPGVAVSSGWIGPIGSSAPTAVISGNDSLCKNDPAPMITVSLTGEPSWKIRYRRYHSGRSDDYTINYIKTTPYIFAAPGDGTYTLLSVADTNYTSGTVSGSAVIAYYPSSTARLTGSAQICQDGPATTMSIDFTGTAPWTFTLRKATKDTVYNNITRDPYSFSAKQPGTYRIISLHDKYCTGDTVAGYGNAIISYITSPRATISGIDTICPGDTAELQVSLEGTPPFSITYLKDGSGAKTITGISKASYLLKVTADGTFTLTAVSDNQRSGCVSGSGKVIYYAVPTATISGSTAICEYSQTNLRVTLTGTPPWNFSYHRNAEVPIAINKVNASPKMVSVNKAGTYTLVKVNDKYCNGSVSGNVTITVTKAPVVSISGLNPVYSTQTLKVPVFGNPHGGSFIPPLLEIHDTSYFFPYLVGPGVHSIIYAYRDPGTGCYGYDTTAVIVLSANADIIFPENDTKKQFCYNDPSFTITGNNTLNAPGTFSISGGIGLTDHGDNSATISPSQLNGGWYTVTYRYYGGTELAITDSFEVEYVHDIRIVDFDAPAYCRNVDPIKLNGNMNGGVFSGNAVYGNAASGYYFKPDLTVAGPDTVFYTYTTSHGCSRQIFKSLIINDAPDVNFTVNDSCLYYASSDSTEFINLTASVDTIIAWYWNFDDVNSGEWNNSGLRNPKHKYSEAGRKDVVLQATTDKNCSTRQKITLHFQDKPTAAFRWATECFHSGQKITLINQSASNKGEISRYKWKIHNSDGADSLDTQNADYQFATPGNYDIELFISTDFGCSDTTEKTLYLRPTYMLEEGASYFEGFEGGMAGWISSSEDAGPNSWTLAEPSSPFGVRSGSDEAWFTRITSDTLSEQSYVTSPCFSFSGIVKPMIKFDMFRLFNDVRDGVVFQYTADSGQHWNNVGRYDDGINWYNSTEIEGRPGSSVIGWSGISDMKWTEARHTLDKQKGKNNVQYRFAYGTNGTAKGSHGMAFDNIQIGERKKLTLLEHFTNTGDMASHYADSAINTLANNNPYDIIDIQYHTSFPGIDPFNEQNKVDPRTRAYYYQVSTVPGSILNGGATGTFRFDYDNRPLDTVLVKKQSLFDPVFDIKLHTSFLDNSLHVTADIKPLAAFTGHQLTLHMAVIERIVTGIPGANGDTLYESVLKTSLPDSSFTDDWRPGEDLRSVSRIWYYKDVYDPEELRVIAFIQDENTREIYQAAINEYDLHTGLKDNHYGNNPTAGNFIAYPNPVSGEIFVGFNEPLTIKARADLFDSKGRLVLSHELYPGIKQFRLDLMDLTEGLYLIRITSDNRFMGLQKIILLR